jgi:hypothetical protein
MKNVILISIILLSLNTSSFSKDRMITLNETEVNSLVELLDAAVRAGGLKYSGATSYFFEKIKGAPEIKEQAPIANTAEEKKE